MMIENGTYRGRITDYGVTAVKRGPFQGHPAPVVEFEFNTNEGPKRLWWHGSFREGKGREITMKALATCGLTVDRFDKLADGPQGDALELGREVLLVIEMEELVQDDGTSRLFPRVKWINPISGSKEMMSRTEFLKNAAMQNLKGSFLSTVGAVKREAPPPKPQPSYEIPDLPPLPPHDFIPQEQPPYGQGGWNG